MPPTGFVLNLGSCRPKKKKDKTTKKTQTPNQTKQQKTVQDPKFTWW